MMEKRFIVVKAYGSGGDGYTIIDRIGNKELYEAYLHQKQQYKKHIEWIQLPKETRDKRSPGSNFEEVYISDSRYPILKESSTLDLMAIHLNTLFNEMVSNE